MKLCSNKHDEIFFNGRSCPVCGMRDELQDARDELRDTTDMLETIIDGLKQKIDGIESNYEYLS